MTSPDCAVSGNLSKFFDTVDHDLLMSRVGRKIRDRGVLRLIGSYLWDGVMIEGHRSKKAFAEFKRRVKKLTGRSWGVSMAYRFAKLAEYLRGWMGYFGIAEY